MIATLATLAALTATPAPPPVPTPIVLSGKVATIPAPRMFTLQVGDRRVLVYAGSTTTEDIQVGDRVTVEGHVPEDWMKLSTDELLASTVEVQP